MEGRPAVAADRRDTQVVWEVTGTQGVDEAWPPSALWVVGVSGKLSPPLCQAAVG